MRSESAVQASERLRKYAEEQLAAGRARYRCTIDHYDKIIANLVYAVDCLTEVKRMPGYRDDELDISDTSKQVINEMLNIISDAMQTVGQSESDMMESDILEPDAFDGFRSNVSSNQSESGSCHAGKIKIVKVK